MSNMTTVPGTESGRVSNWFVSLFLMLVILVANGALIVGLMQLLTWSECALLVAAGIAISGGLLYTVTKMSELSRSE